MPSSQTGTKGTAQSSLIQPPLPTPHWGQQSGSAFTVRATINISASPDAVLDTLLNTLDYPRWNNFVPRVAIPSNAAADESQGRLAEGVNFTEHVDMFGNGKPSGLIKMKLIMTTLQTHSQGDDMSKAIKGTHKEGYTVVWLGRALPNWALRSERVHIIMVNEGENVVYDVYETFSGALAGVTKLFVGKALVKRFGQWNEELKGYVERRQ